MASRPTPHAVIEGLLLRSRRVLAHSLIREREISGLLRMYSTLRDAAA
ncbi:MAG: hypothetical protein WCF69_05575 [Mycobacterium sp.]